MWWRQGDYSWCFKICPPLIHCPYVQYATVYALQKPMGGGCRISFGWDRVIFYLVILSHGNFPENDINKCDLLQICCLKKDSKHVSIKIICKMCNLHVSLTTFSIKWKIQCFQYTLTAVCGICMISCKGYVFIIFQVGDTTCTSPDVHFPFIFILLHSLLHMFPSLLLLCCGNGTDCPSSCPYLYFLVWCLWLQSNQSH